MTITTVGYDSNPTVGTTPHDKHIIPHIQTFLGKIFGGFCALVGVFTLTLPIPIVVNSFAGFYKNRLWRNEVAQKKRERVEAQKTEALQTMDVKKEVTMKYKVPSLDAKLVEWNS